MFRSLISLIAMLLLALPAFSRSALAMNTPDDATTTAQPPQDGKLPPNTTVKDSKGRTVRNRGENQNGRVHFRYTGKLKRTSATQWEVDGEITTVTNPASQGSEGPIDVNTNGEPTTVNLDKNGTDPGGHIVTNVTGGNATVNVSGNYNDPSVGGTGNTVNITGNNNSGSGTAGSSGTVNQGPGGNSWNSGGGNWIVRT